MPSLISLICLACGLLQQPYPAEESSGYLYQPAFAIDYVLREPAEPYCPQPGDIFLCTGCEWWAKLGHWVAARGAPQHSGIVVARPDGRLALLEAGPQNTLHCRLVELVPELAAYAQKERVWIRRRRCPLTPEQSARLTAFACHCDGKPFALMRMFGQLTLLRSRSPWFIDWLAGPHGDRYSYFCAELAMESCVAAGLICPECARPAATYPRDIFFGRSENRKLDQHLDLSGWEPPARWTWCPGQAPGCITPRPFLDGDTPQ